MGVIFKRQTSIESSTEITVSFVRGHADAASGLGTIEVVVCMVGCKNRLEDVLVIFK